MISPLVVLLLLLLWPRSAFSPMKTIEPQTMAKIIQDRAAPCRMRIPQDGSGSTPDGTAVRSHGVGGGIAPGAPRTGGAGWGGGPPGGVEAAPASGGGVGACSPACG